MCTFCDIVNGNTDAYIVFEDDYTITFLDRRPLFPGHCLLIPKVHYETISELPTELIQPVFENVRFLSDIIKLTFASEGTFIAVNNKVSQSVPHMHVHIVPRNRKDGLKGFFWPRNPYKDPQHMLDTANKIREIIQSSRNLPGF